MTSAMDARGRPEDSSRRRTVYLPQFRNKLPRFLPLFDFVDATTSSGQREETHVAPQALFLLNGGFVEERARSVARHLMASHATDRDRLEQLHLLVLGRPPLDEEVTDAIAYMSRYPVKAKQDAGLPALQSFCRILFSANEFHFID